MKKLILTLIAALGLLPISTWADVAAGDEVLGSWHTTDDKSVVEVFKRDGHYFAKILSLKEPNWPANDEGGMSGKPKTDRKNPDTQLRTRPIIGIQFMSDFAFVGKNLWEDGKIYDPEVGKTYKCKMTLVDAHHLEVRGYVGFSLLGRTVVWTR